MQKTRHNSRSSVHLNFDSWEQSQAKGVSVCVYSYICMYEAPWQIDHYMYNEAP
jgi:hypothetical protein